MKYKLFIDDERFPLTPDWFVARTSHEAINVIKFYGMPTEIAFDHDLGGDDTSMYFIYFLTEHLLDNPNSLPVNFKWSIHSQNPIGVANIRSKMLQLIEEVNYLKGIA